MKDIDSLFREVSMAGLESVEGEVKSLPFWENGVKFFTVPG